MSRPADESLMTMATFFRKLVDQINPFDGGKTWKNQNPSRPTNIPSYGGGVTGIINRVKDVVSASTPQDYAKRSNSFISNLPKALNLSPEEINQRRTFYSQKGLDIDKIQKIKNYQDALNPGIRTDMKDWTSDFQKLQAEGLATPEAIRDFQTGLTRQNQQARNALIRGAIAKSLDFNGQQFKANQIENEYQKLVNRDKANIPQQALQNFAGGVYSFYRNVPGDLSTVAGAGLDVISPENSRVDKFAEKLFGAGQRLTQQANQDIANRGFYSQNDNQAIAKLSQGAGSLFSMGLIPGGGAGVSVNALRSAPIAAVKKFLLGVRGGAGLAGLQEAGDKIRAAKEAGKSDLASFLTGLGAGATSAYSEQVGLDFLGKPLNKVGGNLIGGIASRALTEGAQESLQTLASNIWEKSYNPDKNLQEGVLESGVISGILGGGVGAIAESPEFYKKFKQQNQTDNIIEFAVSQNPQLQSALIGVNNFVSQNPQFADTAALAIFGGGSLPQVQNAQTQLAQYVPAISGLMAGKNATSYKKRDKFRDPFSNDKLFEIDDTPARLLFRPRPNEKTTLGDFLYHPELFREYPNLKNTPVKFVFDNPLNAGSMTNGEITINTNNPSSQIMSTLLHEIQHGLQRLDKTVYGGSHLYISNKTSLPVQEAFKYYQRLAGEAQSRMIEIRRNNNAPLNKDIPESYDTNPYSLINQKDLVRFLETDKKAKRALLVYSAHDHLRRGTLGIEDLPQYVKDFGYKDKQLLEDAKDPQKAYDAKKEIERRVNAFVDKKNGRKARKLRDKWQPIYPEEFYVPPTPAEKIAISSPTLESFIRSASKLGIGADEATQIFGAVHSGYINPNQSGVKINTKKSIGAKPKDFGIMAQNLNTYGPQTSQKYENTINNFISKLDKKLPDNYKTVGDKQSDSIAMRDSFKLDSIFEGYDWGETYEYRSSQHTLGEILYNVTEKLKVGSTKKDIMDAYKSALFSNLKTLEESNRNQNNFDKTIANGSGDITLYRVTTDEEDNSGAGVFYSPNKAYVETYVATNKLDPNNLKKYTINIDNLKIYKTDNLDVAYKNVFGRSYRAKDTYYDGELIDELWDAESKLHSELAKRGYDAVVYKEPQVDNGFYCYTFGFYPQPREVVILNSKLPKTISSTSYSQFGDKRQNNLEDNPSLARFSAFQYKATYGSVQENVDLKAKNLPPKQQLATDLADLLYQFDKSVKTELVVLGDGTKKKVSPHSQFYRDFYKNFRRRPTKADFLDHATSLLETGRAPIEFQDEYNKTMAEAVATPTKVAQPTTREQDFISRYMDKVYNPLIPITELENQLADWSFGAPEQSVPANALISILDKYYNGSLEEMVTQNFGKYIRVQMPKDKPTSEIGMLGMSEKQKEKIAKDALGSIPIYQPPTTPDPAEKPLNEEVVSDLEDKQKTQIEEIKKADSQEQETKKSLTKEELEAQAEDKFTTDRINPFTQKSEIMKVGEYLDLMIEYWAAQRNATKTITSNLLRDLPKPPQDLAWKTIEALEEKPENWSPEIAPFAKAYREFFDKMLKFGNDNGLDIKKWNEYVTHIWEDPFDDVVSIFDEYKKLNPDFKYSKKRIIPDYETGIILGLTPKYRTPQEIVEQYTQRMLGAVNDKLLMDQLVKDKLVSRGMLEPGFTRQVTAPGFTVDKAQLYLAPAFVAKKLDNIFRDQQAYTLSEKAVKKIAQAARVAQDVGLSGGIPFTPLNAFSFANIQRYLLAGKGATPMGALIHSFSKGKTEKFFEQNRETILKMQQSGYDIPVELDIQPPQELSKIDKLKTFWDAAISDATFKRFLPMLQVRMWQQINSEMIKKGLPEKEANRRATKILQNFEGQKNVGKAAQQSRFLDDLASIGLFAPRYRGAMVRFWANNFTGSRTISKYNRRFMIGAVLTYAAYDFLNMIINGVHLWANPDGKEDKLLIPLPDGNYLGVPFLSSIATVPRAIGLTAYHTVKGSDSDTFLKDVKGFSSYLLKPILDVVTNENYFGAQIVRAKDTKTKTKDSPIQAAIKRGAYLGGAFIPTSLREPLKTFTEKQPLYQTATQMLEAPLRYYDPTYFKYKGEDNTKPNIRIKYPDAVDQKKAEQIEKKKAEQGFSNANKVKAESGLLSQNEMQYLKNAVEMFYKYENRNGGISTDEKLKNAYKSSSLTPESRQITDFLNTTNLWQKPANTPTLEASNSLAILFADTLEKAKNKNVAEKYSLLNNFWTDAVKMQYSETAQSLVGMDDNSVKNLLDSGGINERQWQETLSLNLDLTKMTGKSPLGKDLVGYTATSLKGGGGTAKKEAKISRIRVQSNVNTYAPNFSPTKARKIKIAKNKKPKIKVKI